MLPLFVGLTEVRQLPTSRCPGTLVCGAQGLSEVLWVCCRCIEAASGVMRWWAALGDDRCATPGLGLSQITELRQGMV